MSENLKSTNKIIFEEGEVDENEEDEEPDKERLIIGEEIGKDKRESIVFDELDEDEDENDTETLVQEEPKKDVFSASAKGSLPKTEREPYLNIGETEKKDNPPQLRVPEEKPPLSVKENQERRKKRGDKGDESIYEKVLITRNVNINILNIGKNIEMTIKTILMEDYEGKCSIEGYIKKDSVQIITYSNGLLNGNNVIFTVMFSCLVCFPVEGMNITCVAKNITKAGISAESFSEDPTPFIVFVSRDHHNNNPNFNKIQTGDKFDVKVIGQRFELNDEMISIIAELKKVKTGPRFEF